MELKKDFNVYLANLAVMTFKLHNLHWNVEGETFVQIHLYTEEVYDETFEYFDSVAEHQKMFGHTPDSRLSDYLENATIKELDAKKFTPKEVVEILLADIEVLRDGATSLRNRSDENGWFSAVAMLEDQIASYNKRIWFLKAMLG